MVRNKSSNVWSFFDSTVGKNKVKCKFCCAGLRCTDSNTSGMSRHLKAKHADKFSDLEKFIPLSAASAAQKSGGSSGSGGAVGVSSASDLGTLDDNVAVADDGADLDDINADYGIPGVGESYRGDNVFEDVVYDDIGKVIVSAGPPLKRPALNVSVSSSSSTAADNFGRPASSMTIDQYLTQPWSANGEFTKEANAFFLRAMIECGLPFSLAENSSFIDFLHALRPQYNPSDSRFYSDVLLLQVYNKVVEQLKADLAEVHFLSLTSDTWSESDTSLLSLTAQWLDSNFQLQSAVLNAVPLNEDHTADNIAENFTEMMAFWKIREKVVVVLRDSARNMVAACERANMDSEDCFVHKLQLVINGVMKDPSRTIRDICARVRSIVRYICHSTVLQQDLLRIQEETFGVSSPLELIQDTETRWDSTADMLTRFVQLKDPVAILVAQASVEVKLNLHFNFSDSEWEIITNVGSALFSFKEVTEKAAQRSASVSLIIPSVQCLRHKLQSLLVESSDKNRFIKTFLQQLLTGLNERFLDVEQTWYMLATYLDPRFRNCFLNESDVEDIRNKLLVAFEEFETALQKPTPLDVETPGDEDIEVVADPEPAPPNSSGSVFDFVRQRISKLAHMQQGHNFSRETALSDMVAYEQSALVAFEGDPFKWWLLNQARFPCLAALAKKYLAVPPSSVDGERLWSSATGLYGDRRQRLLDNKLEMILFLKANPSRLETVVKKMTF